VLRRLLSPRWLVRHAIVAVLVGGCVALGWWQVGRAAGGNTLSLGYAFEWPAFALFVLFIWIREMRLALHLTDPEADLDPEADPDPEAEPPLTVPAASSPTGPAATLLTRLPEGLRRGVAPDPADQSDAGLHAYNTYLAWLAEDPARHPADYPGPPPADQEAAGQRPEDPAPAERSELAPKESESRPR
jgi:hypothetical protein